MSNISFKNLFFRYYDRKISDGSITFSQLGISKMDFTRLCTEDDFVLDQETLERVCTVMKLTEEEKVAFYRAATRRNAIEDEE